MRAHKGWWSGETGYFYAASGEPGFRNVVIQIFDLNGRYLREWKLGHPFGLFVTPDHFIYMSDAIAGRILKIDRDGKVVGALDGPAPDKGRHFDPHSLVVAKDNSIFTAEVMPWQAQKFRLK